MSDAIWLKRDASKKIRGWRTTTIEISDKTLKNSPSTALKDRSTKRKRLRILSLFKNRRGGEKTKRTLANLMELGIIETPEDYVRPVMFVIQKPRKEPKGKRSPGKKK